MASSNQIAKARCVRQKADPDDIIRIMMKRAKGTQ